MNWITLSWPMAIAACLTLAAIHGLIALRVSDRSRAAHLFFTLSAIAVAAVGAFELSLLHTTDLPDYQRKMRWAGLPLWLMFVSLAGFTWNFLERGRAWPALATAILSTISALGNFLVPASMRVRHAVHLNTGQSLWGAPFTVPELQSGWLTACEVLAALFLMAFVADASWRSWRKGDRRRALQVGGSIVVFLLLTRGYAGLVEAGILRTPFFFIFPFLGLLLAMGRQLSLDVIRAAQLTGQLLESERRMELAARAATLGFWLWDFRDDSLWATESARRLFGFSPSEPLDFQRFFAALHPEDRSLVRRAVDRAVATGEDYEAEYRIGIPGDGYRWISARGKVEAGPDGMPRQMRGVVIDVTERKTAQVEVDGMRRDLAHMSRASMMGELAGSLAHELNQPLAAILSNAQAARRFLAKPNADLAKIQEILDDIVKDDKRAGEVIHRLRSLVEKKERGGCEVLNPNELVRDVERMLHSESVGRNIVLSLSLDPDPPQVFAGRVEMQQVLLNLFVNAMDAMRDLPGDDRVLGVETRTEFGRCLVLVRDRGPGIPDDLLPKIFLPFFTTKQHGLGMGLAISRSLVEAQGGTLSAANLPGGGALFTVSLPLPTA